MRRSEEGGKLHRVQSAHSGDGVALDAGNLHKSVYGVAGKSEVVFHTNLCGVFNLSEVEAEQLRNRRGSHTARSAALRLTAALRSAYGRVGFNYVAYYSRRSKRAVNVLVRKAVLMLLVIKHCGNYSAGSAGRGGDYRASACVLLRNSKGVCADKTVFVGFGTLLYKLGLE